MGNNNDVTVDLDSSVTSSGGNLTISERQQQIIDMVKGQGFVSIEILSQHFLVTPQTIRRDINKLCKDGLLTRYHGGAGLSSSVENLSYMERQAINIEGKCRIANLLAGRIPDHASLFINLGTTTEEVAKALTNQHGLRIITNNLNVASILSANESFEVIVAGGVVRSRDRGITGEATIDFIKQFKVDYGIIGVSGIDVDGTLLDFDYHEVRVAREIIANSRKVFLIADHTKFGRNAMVRLGNMSEIDALFTDTAPTDTYLDMLKASDVEIFVSGEQS